MHDKIISNGESEKHNEENRNCDSNYEGFENSEDIETSLIKDGELPTVNEAGPFDSSPTTRHARATSQVGNSRRSTHDRLGQKENVAESQGTRRA